MYRCVRPKDPPKDVCGLSVRKQRSGKLEPEAGSTRTLLGGGSALFSRRRLGRAILRRARLIKRLLRRRRNSRLCSSPEHFWICSRGGKEEGSPCARRTRLTPSDAAGKGTCAPSRNEGPTQLLPTDLRELSRCRGANAMLAFSASSLCGLAGTHAPKSASVVAVKGRIHPPAAALGGARREANRQCHSLLESNAKALRRRKQSLPSFHGGAKAGERLRHEAPLKRRL